MEAAGKRRLWIILAGSFILMTLLGAAGWAARPAYRHYKEQRSLRQMRTFIAQGDYRNGLLCLRQVLGLNPGNLEAVKLMADVATQTQAPAALGWWQRVVELAPTAEHRALLLAAALRVEAPPYPVATETLAQLAATGTTNVGYHLLAAQLALKCNDGARAEQHLESARALEPTNRLHQINLATLRLQSRQPGPAEAARTELAGWSADPHWGTTVLRTLVADALLRSNAPAAVEFSARLLQQPEATFPDRLQDATAVWQAGAAQLPERIRALQQAAGTNVLFITQVAWWLNQHGQPAETLTWLATQPAERRSLPMVALAEAEALVRTGQWAELEQRLTGQKWEDQEFVRLAYLARALREQGRSTMAAANWDRATGAAGRRAERVGGLVQLAFNWQWPEEAVALLWQQVRQQPQEDWPVQLLVRTYTSRQDSDGLRRVHEELRRRQPDSLPIKNNYAMLCLLVGYNPAATQVLAREVYEAAPTNGIFASTYALAQHLAGDSHAALAVMKTLPAAEQNRTEVAAYAALFRAATGEKEAARPVLTAAARTATLPEERELFAAALR